MSPESKNLFDAIITVVGMTGAAVAFIYARQDWREAQRWKRAEQLNEFVTRFETDPLLRLASAVTDWTSRTVMHNGHPFQIHNNDALLALRNHETMEDDESFEGEQDTIRDAYDALLAFFTRLELALHSELIDVEPTRSYFRYWLERFTTMDRHPDDDNCLKGRLPVNVVWEYIDAYGEIGALCRLCDRFGLRHPVVAAD
jgi:hypothetical protein